MKPFLASIILFFSSYAMPADPLRVGIVHFPPMFIVENGNVVGGSVVEIMEKTLNHASLDYRLISYPAKRAYVSLGTGAMDLHGGLKKNVHYHDQVIYSNNTIVSVELRVYGFGDAPLPQSIPELRGKQLGLIRGFQYGGKLPQLTDIQNEKFVTTIDSHSSALLMLESGRIDFLLDYKSPVDSELKLYPLPEIQHTTIEKLDLYFVLNKNRPNAREIMTLLNASYLSLFPEHTTENTH
ncbi:MAG: polar amino acid transport system substrate-binding protein [Oceanicoccus sp.]|jgi:polar amino acid transport system substrate-binding protein